MFIVRYAAYEDEITGVRRLIEDRYSSCSQRSGELVNAGARVVTYRNGE